MGLATALPTTAAAEPARYRFDPTHTFVLAEVVHFGASTLRIRFGPIEGQAELDAAAGRGRVQLTLPLTTLSSGVPALDERLRRADLFDVAAQPQAWFVAEQLQFAPDGALRSVRGELTLRGRSRGLTLAATRFRCYLQPLLRREVCGGEFEGTLLRSDLGLDLAQPFVDDRVTLRVTVEGIRED